MKLASGPAALPDLRLLAAGVPCLVSATLAERLADYAITLEFTDLPPAVVHEVKRRLIDSFGCAIGAWRATPSGAARRVALRASADTGATVWGTPHRAPPDLAAFANGILVRELDYNDVYVGREFAHPSDNIPAAIAVAQAEGASGRELITAVALAYEIQCRFCDAANLRTRGWDHATYGAFSTALAAAKLMKLDAAQTCAALNIAGAASTALRQTRLGELSPWDACAFAHAARQGVFAAELARAGLTGPAPVFEGENGFENMVSGPLAITFGVEFLIMKTSLKLWPAAFHSQTAIAAALQVRRAIENPADIDAVTVATGAATLDSIGRDRERRRPTSRETAMQSLPYIVAAALLDGTITAQQFSAERRADDRLLDLVPRISIEPDAVFTERYPDSIGNEVTVRLRDGRRLTARVADPPGHPRAPLSDAQVEEKFLALANPVLRRDQVEGLLHWIWQLDTAENLAVLPCLLEVIE